MQDGPFVVHTYDENGGARPWPGDDEQFGDPFAAVAWALQRPHGWRRSANLRVVPTPASTPGRTPASTPGDDLGGGLRVAPAARLGNGRGRWGGTL
ncbi:hypothetical protein GCM10027456_40270 [Kineosporia babensis]